MTNPNKPDQALVVAWMESLEFEWVQPRVNSGYWQNINDNTMKINTEQATFFYQAHVAAATAAEESVAFAIVSTKTEGIVDDGDIFIKQEPLNQTIVDIVGYEKFKAMQEALTASPKQGGVE